MISKESVLHIKPVLTQISFYSFFLLCVFMKILFNLESVAKMYWLSNMPSELNLQEHCTFPVSFSDLPSLHRRKKKEFQGKEEISISNMFMGIQCQMVYHASLLLVNQSKKMMVASIMFCETMHNFSKGKRSHSAYFSNVLYFIAIDRCLQNKITKLQK